MYEVTVKHSFKAGHALRLPGGGLEQPHEHLWGVTATFRRRQLDETTGVVVDFLRVRGALEAATAELEGAELNAFEAFAKEGCSAERLAEFLARKLIADLGGEVGLYRLEVTEAPGCSAAFYP